MEDNEEIKEENEEIKEDKEELTKEKKKKAKGLFISLGLYLAFLITGIVFIMIYIGNRSVVIFVSIILVILSAFFSYYIRRTT